ncbi:PAS domain S-box/diguanylate cyclase (GGDEF) domain [Chelatococcus sambhunathii]|uniref:PAS domain S-box/diguanylate cyclase (GGDEF) domain n=1 Tax=Chelatococcus sambhunathii TaxID=363953 RepID=A0ABM9U2S6_9HYPH|nr:PAS domain-containing protein [Chelatococcus sambhunathii]CUA86953.1 PAS domain S-box/diguanylate cyclase (GGDEF) domain [Chelatococcus sambhunathii]
MPRRKRRLVRRVPSASDAWSAPRLRRQVNDLSRRFDRIINGTPQMLWTSRADGKGDAFNKAWHDFVGVPPGTITSDNLAQWIHPDDRARVRRAWRRALSAQDGYEIDYRLRHHSGAYRWVTARGAPTYDADGRMEGWLGTTIDIDDRKKAELLLALNAQRYRALHETSAMVLWIALPDGRVTEQWGWASVSAQEGDDFRDWGWLAAVHPEDRQRVMARWQTALAGGSVYDASFRVLTRSGDFRWVEARAVPVRDADGAIREWVGKLSDIHERMEAEESLRASEERLRLAVESTALGIWDADFVTGRREWNTQARAILGLPDEMPVDRDSFRARVHPDDREEVERRFFVDSPADGSVYRGEYRILRADTGEERWVAATGRTVVDGRGRPVRKIGTVRDITERKRSLQALSSSERRLRLALQAARMIAWEQDLTTGFVTRSENAVGILGIGSGPVEEILACIHPQDRQLRRDFLRSPDCGDTIEIRYLRPDGQRLWLAIRGERVGNDRLVGVTFDITAQKQAEEEAWRMASLDGLTGLSNRASFQETLEHICSGMSGEAPAFSLLLVDLDHFKDVNDTLGHDAGDQLLMEVGARLRRAVRAGDVVARFGGDEFAVLVREPPAAGWAEKLAERIRTTLLAPFATRGRTFATRASIGIATFPHDGANAKDLLKSADIALYRAKAEGRNRFVTYTPALRAAVEERIALVEDVRRGLRAREIVPYYQPKVCLASGRIVGFEALARWNHPDRGLLTPASFSVAFEDPELSRALGEQVLACVTADMRHWLDHGLAPVQVAVNVSPAEFSDRRLASSIMEMLDRRGIPARWIEVEITEAVFLDQMLADAAATLQELHAAGFSIALDDFGTGYASLSHLKRFPIDHIKIDKSFIHEIERNEDDEAIVSAVIHLGHRMKMQITAEGVETLSQASRLHELGCDNAQGHLYAGAMSACDVTAFLTRLPGDESRAAPGRRGPAARAGGG